MDTRNKKRITAGLGLAAAAGAALAVTAGTFAYFSDAEASANQTISTGTLDLVPGGNAVTDPIKKVADLENGCNEPEQLSEPNCAADNRVQSDSASFVVKADLNQS